jgi:hypothetical protein
LMSEPMAMIFGVVSRLTGFPIMVLYPWINFKKPNRGTSE